MYTLGISCYYHDSAAALLKDGHVIAAVEEERFSRKKFDDDFPKEAIQWCLKQSDISSSQITSIAFYDKPVLKFDRLLDNYIAVAPRGLKSFLDIIPKSIHKRLWIKNEIKKNLKGFCGEIIFLGILFVFLISVYGILFKVLRIDLLRLKKSDDTYWLEMEQLETYRLKKQY